MPATIHASGVSNLGFRYGLALLATALAGLLRWQLQGLFGQSLPFVTFYPVVAVVALLAGAGPGILATGLSCLITLTWFINPSHPAGASRLGAAVGTGFFGAASVGVSLLAELLRRSWQREQDQRLSAHLMRTEQMLSQAHQRLITALENMSDGFIAFDRQWRFTYINSAAACTMMDCTLPSLLLGRNLWEAFPTLVNTPIHGYFRRSLEQNTPVQFEYRSPSSGRWFEGRCQPTPEGLVVYFDDITDRKMAEEALRASEEFNRRLFNSSYDCIKVLDLAANVLSMNEGGLRLMDIEDPAPYLNRPYLNFWKEEDQPMVRQALAAALAGGMGQFEGYSPGVRDTPRWWDVRVTPIRGVDGQPERLLVVARDTTERKATEQALRDALAKLDRHTANSPLAVIEWDGQFRITGWNPAAERLFGWNAAEALGAPIDALPPIHQEDWPAVCRLMAEMLNGTSPSGISRNRNYRKDGSVIECEWHSSALYDERGKLRSVLSRVADVTERNRTERELAAAKLSAERAMALAKEASRAKDHFLAVLSHELRTPLTPVLTTTNLLERDRRFPDCYREDMEVIHRNVELEARLIDDLLDVTRIARGKIELDRKPIQVGEIIRRTVEVCMSDIEARQLQLELDLGDAGSSVVQADSARLQQVFWNLLKNAIKFTPHGGQVGIRARGEEDNDGKDGAKKAVVIEISDKGEGIDPQFLPEIFKPFEQGGRGVTRQFGGLGLGLTIAKGLVEMHGGSISAHSEGKGQGATFRVKVPVAPAAAGPGPSFSAGNGPAAPLDNEPPAPVRPLRILLVEDHGDTARAMRRLLCEEGHEVQTAGDMTTGLEAAMQHEFDLLISDLGLPDGSGLDLMERLRACGRALPGIALSGYGQEEDILKSRDAGFAIHLTKPTNPDRLQEAIATLSKQRLAAAGVGR